jgi:hypothetical protein
MFWPMGAHRHIFTFGEFLGFSGTIGATHNKTVGMVVILQQLSQNAECLHRQLAGRGQDDDAGSVPRHELQLVDELDGRYEEG